MALDLLLLPFFFRELPTFRCCLVDRLGVVLAEETLSPSMFPRLPRFIALLPYNCVEEHSFVLLGTTTKPSTAASADKHGAANTTRAEETILSVHSSAMAVFQLLVRFDKRFAS